MQKVVFEMSHMPKNCADCVLSTKKNYDGKEVWACPCFTAKVIVDIKSSERYYFCPLETINTID